MKTAMYPIVLMAALLCVAPLALQAAPILCDAAASTQPLVAPSASSLVGDVVITCAPEPFAGSSVSVKVLAVYSAPVVDFMDARLVLNETDEFLAEQPEENQLQWNDVLLSILAGESATLRLTNVHVNTLGTPGPFPVPVIAQIFVLGEEAPGALNPVAVALVGVPPTPSVPEPATAVLVVFGAMAAAVVQIARKRLS